ncbi:SDR family NAD(P)-dependent oxidoreductase [Xanthomonas albilineans]|uniref:Putative short chain dehydrogenase oxidoreductase protein n=1 Tax=Xanthomonas albilineans (strain GPE PC73 / CFBP 7063) TaxID=380358 RepID=D2UDA8_XANAP|nr:SDR family oxidoreductase [Xanthomonas albilineans]QHQ28129.1 putative short chain dehydrogenase oxidoreductase protein [Xanthomonas albilineans]CBA15912.1 putative short chain dehydrogenase oxidoreductase protein [Xanthomonas albilineans GPE PC73]
MAPVASTDAFALKGKTILVTGASSGIGAAVATLCARLGATLVLNGRDETRLQAVASILHGSEHRTVAGDLTEEATRTRLLEAAERYHGLASCAGIAALVPFRMAAEKHLQQMLAVNYLAPIILTQQLLAKRRLHEGASLVYISALSARAAPPAGTGYAASKAALEAAVRTLALEQGKHGIRANCIAPGYVQTPMLQKLGSAADMGDRVGLNALGDIDPDDIAKGAVYLLSAASRWVTRTTLTIDGGTSMPIRL